MGYFVSQVRLIPEQLRMSVTLCRPTCMTARKQFESTCHVFFQEKSKDVCVGEAQWLFWAVCHGVLVDLCDVKNTQCFVVEDRACFLHVSADRPE